MKQAQIAFIAHVKKTRPEHANKTDEQIIDLTNLDELTDSWNLFCSGWNAAVLKSKEIKENP